MFTMFFSILDTVDGPNIRLTSLDLYNQNPYAPVENIRSILLYILVVFLDSEPSKMPFSRILNLSLKKVPGSNR